MLYKEQGAGRTLRNTGKAREEETKSVFLQPTKVKSNEDQSNSTASLNTKPG